MKFKTTSLEKKWIWYDVGNSAFTLLITTLLPIFFHEIAEMGGVAEADYLSYWAYTSSLVTIILVFLGPTLGTLSDLKGVKRKIFSACVLVGAISCALLGFVSHWCWFLGVFILAKTAYQMSLVVYDSMLGDVTTADRMDEVSSKGYAWGYIGSCAPFIVTVFVYVMYAMLGWISMTVSAVLCCLIIAVWWIGWTIPLYKSYEQKHYISGGNHPVQTGFKNLTGVLGELKQNKKVLLFLIAFFFFIDGVYTIIDMATSYGTSLGLDTVGLLAALLVTQIVAFPSALIFGRLSGKKKPESLIVVCIIAYFIATVYAAFMTQLYQFWILAVVIGMFQGSIQSLSRSYFAKIIPQNKSGEYFGIYDIFGKGASFMGTMIVGLVTQLTGKQNLGVGAIAVLFPFGLLFFLLSAKAAQKTG